MKNNLLDLQGYSDSNANREVLQEYKTILKNPDLLGRLFRVFMLQHTRKTLWKDALDAYLQKNADKPHSWINDRKTNLERVLFKQSTVSWDKFLEGLVIVAPSFDTLTVRVFSTLNDGAVTELKINPSSYILNSVKVDELPKGLNLAPPASSRSPMEPLPLRVVRDAISTIETSAQFREIARKNLKGSVHSSKISSGVNSLYVSVLKSEMSWKRMTSILFALGATQLIVSIRGTKNGEVYKSVAQVRR